MTGCYLGIEQLSLATFISSDLVKYTQKYVGKKN